jgi:hypothetical protein
VYGKRGDMARSKKAKVRVQGEPTQQVPLAESEGEKRNLGTAAEVAAEIATKCDLVTVGCELLGKGGEAKGASVKLRMWESIMQRLYGKLPEYDGVAPEKNVNIVWSWDVAKRQPDPESDAT